MGTGRGGRFGAVDENCGRKYHEQADSRISKSIRVLFGQYNQQFLDFLQINAAKVLSSVGFRVMWRGGDLTGVSSGADRLY